MDLNSIWFYLEWGFVTLAATVYMTVHATYCSVAQMEKTQSQQVTK